LDHNAYPIGLGDVDGDGDSDVITSSAHDYGVWWHEQLPGGNGERFQMHEISKKHSQTHAIRLADLNRDGIMDFVTGDPYRAGFDAFLYLGPLEDEIVSPLIPGFYTDEYAREIDRRTRLMHGHGLDSDPAIGEVSGEAIRRLRSTQSGSVLPLRWGEPRQFRSELPEASGKPWRPCAPRICQRSHRGFRRLPPGSTARRKRISEAYFWRAALTSARKFQESPGRIAQLDHIFRHVGRGRRMSCSSTPGTWPRFAGWPSSR
jgi:hypothetical protein